jgi:formylglycine-generating enzyme required for sulfatase activity
MPRLFISHSSKDNVDALAFRRWLVANGWAESDVFIDLHGIGAGERWRERLRKANAACEAVVLLASPNSLGSIECEKELELAEALGKPIIPVIVRDLTVNHPRLAQWADRQIVDLSQQPAERIEPFEYEGQLHRAEFSVAALASIKARLADLGIAPGSFAWEPRKRADGKDAGPYLGLAAFGEDDAGIFFGREADIVAGLAKLRLMRKRRSPRLFVIQAASGAGKSSFLKAGLWPRLKRDPDFAPLCILRPARGILTGPDGIGQRIAPWFERQRRTKVPGDIEASLTQPDRPAAVSALAALLAEATALATTARRAGVVDARPPAPLLAIDQGEELFASENVAESERFLELLAAVFNDLPEDVDPYVLVTIRADSVEPLLQRCPALRLAPPETQMLPPLSPTAYRDVIIKPAEVYTGRVRRLAVDPALAGKLALDATGGDALPLLAFTLEKLFEKFGVDGNLTLQRYESMKGFGGSIDTALGEAMRQTGAGGTPDNLRRLVVPGLATWDPAANVAKRLVAAEADLLGGKSEIIPLANALVANRLLTRGAGTLEVTHEALLRRPPLDGWLEQQKDALKLRDDVLREAKEWADGGRHAESLVRHGERLQAALGLGTSEDFKSALAPAAEYLKACRKQERSARSRARRTQAAIFTLLLAIIGGFLARMYEHELRSFVYWATTFRGHQLAARLKPGEGFQECAMAFSDDRQDGKQISKYCPDMVVIPAGSYKMGNEQRARIITIKTPFAVSRFTITFDQWDACAAGGGCENNTRPGDQNWGRGSRPVINVDWSDAQNYVAWLNRMTGTGSYRLLSEAEWEYAARGVTSAQAPHPDYPWGNEIGRGNANCDGCGSRWDNKQTAPVGSFKDNAGLYDMHGNVWQWVEDCYAEELDGAPADGAVWKEACKETSSRVVRGGSWINYPDGLRSSNRIWLEPGLRSSDLGFRVARVLSSAGTLLPP